MERDGFPAIAVDRAGAVAFVVLQGADFRRLRLGEGRFETGAGDLFLRHAAQHGRRFDAEHFEHGGHHVDGVRVLVADLAARRDALGPRHDARIGDAAVMDVALPALEGRVAGIRPAGRIVVVGFFAAQIVVVLEVLFERIRDTVEDQILVERAEETAFPRSAVVRHQQDERVIEIAQRFERLDQTPDVIIGVGQEARKDLHHARVEALFVGGHRLPRLDHFVARRELGAGRDEAQLELALMRFLAIGVPSSVEPAAVFRDPLLRSLMRRVLRAGAEVHEERLGRVGRTEIAQERNRLIGQILGEVIALLRRRLDVMIIVHQIGMILIGLRAEEAVEPIEAPAQRPAIERPRHA